MKELQNPEKLYSVKINVEELENESLYNFIETIQAFEFGEIIEGGLPKPVIMPPILNLQKSVERLKEHKASVSENILSYLHEVAIYINGDCSLNCKRCQETFKQYLCCRKSENTLPLTAFKNFLSTISHLGVSITILGGNIFHYIELTELIHILISINAIHTITANWRHIPDDSELLGLLSHESLRFKIIADEFSSIESMLTLVQRIKQHNINQLWEIYITSLSDYEEAKILSDLIVTQNIDVNIRPIYDGENRAFFEKNVFIGKEELDNIVLTRQDIFARQSLNTNDFGKIVVSSDGKVYANINDESIGYIYDSIGELLCKELENGTSWRRTRYNIEPCCQCRFQLLCPSPSNYERAIVKPNLCHIK